MTTQHFPRLTRNAVLNANGEPIPRKGSAVVLLSGGQDSMTCMHYALQSHGAGNVVALGFNYGQRHAIELMGAHEMAEKSRVPFKVVDVPALTSVGTSALTGSGSVSKPHPTTEGVPASFVPARNAMFLTLAHAYALTIGAETVYGGMCQTDYSGYPDCRQGFISTLESALNIGYCPERLAGVTFNTPLMYLTKADTFALAEALGVLDDVVEHSHTCYEGKRDMRHDWGYGCGECPACELRRKGWEDYLEQRGEVA